MNNMIQEKLEDLLKGMEFVYVASCSPNGCPKVAPKLFLKFEDAHIYLVDHVRGTTCENLKKNAAVSFAVMDQHSLHGYQINGVAEILEEGEVFETLIRELRAKETHFTADRLIEAVRTGKRHEEFEVALPREVAIFKIKVSDIIEINPRGQVSRAKL